MSRDEIIEAVLTIVLAVVVLGTLFWIIFNADWSSLTDTEPLVELYTGLKDKNGKEIYVGDIVEYTTCYFGNEKRHRKVVEWEEWDSDDFGEPHNLGFFDLSEYMEVIGNIHENPELMEGEK